MYDTGARVPRRLWYPVWETTSLPPFRRSSINPEFPPFDSSQIGNVRSKNRIESAENNTLVPVSSDLKHPILFVDRPMRSEDSREREKKHSSSASPNSILSPRGPKLSLSLSLSSNVATVERSWIARKPFSTVFIRDFYPEATRSRPLFKSF